MRPGEACRLCLADLDRGGEPWALVPDKHKTEHLGKRRTIYLGPKARAVHDPWLVEAESDPTGPALPIPSKRGRRPDGATEVYARLVREACDKAGVPRWHPNQLRHNFATMLREFGLETAKAALCHDRLETTRSHAEADLEAARRAVTAIG
jgi:integrase